MAAEPRDQALEYGEVDRLDEVHAYGEAFNPANLGF
jgi:hypothetical protein